jgi:titin
LEVSYGSVDYDLIYSGPSVSYSFSVPVYDETYSFRLRVNNKIGYSEYSNILTTKFSSIPEKMSPPNFDELNTDSRNNKIPYIKVSWTNSNNDNSITGYKLEMKLSSDSDTLISTIYEDININTLSYTIYQDNNNIIVGNTYDFYISCTNERGYSERSEQLSVLFATIPDALTSLNSNSVTKTSVTLSWSISNIFNGGSEIQGYILQNKLSTETSYSNSIPLSGINTLTYSYSSLTTGLTYNFRIAAFNDISDINLLNFSDEISVLIATIPRKITTFEQDLTNLVKNEVTIKWKAPSDNGGLAIQSYTIKRETTIGSGIYISINTITSSTNTFSYSDTSPTSPTQNYKILCTNNVGDSEESDELLTYVGIKPGKVINLSATSISSTSITFTYEAPDNVNDLNNPIDHYYIISYSPISSYTDTPVDNNLNFEYTLDSISSNSGSSFKFKVYAHNNLGNGDYSDEITILNCGSPGTPVITVNSRTVDSITFSFSPNSNDISDTSCPIKTFEFYRESSLIYSQTNNILSYTDSGLTNGVTYSYTLKYYNIVKNPGSVTKSFIIGTIPNIPTSITIDSVDKDGNLKISWTNDNGENTNVDIISNNILIALSNEEYDDTNKISVTDMTSLSCTWNNLTEGSTYKIKISAINSIGESDYSSDKTVIIASPPDPIQSLTYSSLTSNSITISYQSPTNNNGDTISGYNIYLGDTLLEKVADLTYTYSSLIKSNEYTMSVSAINSIGESSLESITFYACDKPSKPGIPTLISKTSNTINFKWKYSDDNGGCNILEYEIYYKTSNDSGFTSLATITDIYHLQYSHIITSTSTDEISYYVRAKNSNGYSEFSDTATFNLSS